MESLIIHIGASENHFGAFAENCPGIYGAGDTVLECKENVMEGLRLFIENTEPTQLPDLLKGEYQIVYTYDTQSLLKYYGTIFTAPAMERLTGINQKQLHHYASGLRKPRAEQRKKIVDAFHKLGKELIAVTL